MTWAWVLTGARQNTTVMKVLAIQGSYNKTGNSAHLLDKFLDGLQTVQKCTIKRYDVAHQKIGLCRACYACSGHDDYFCAQKDDAPAILLDYLDADLVVFSYPVYFIGIPGQVKNLVDRFVGFYKDGEVKEQYVAKFAAKQVVAIVNCAEDVESYCVDAGKGIGGLIYCIPSKYEELHVPGCYGDAIVAKDASKQKKAFDFGVKMGTK